MDDGPNKKLIMNPFSAFLRRNLRDRSLRTFASRWDRAEDLVIRTYRREIEPVGAQKEWRKLRRQLLKAYPKFSGQLSSFWKQSTIAGKEPDGDPFATILSHEQVSSFEGNWKMLQTLPAAREAINMLVISREKRG